MASTGVLDCCQSIKVSERVPTSNPQRLDIVFKCCPHLLVTTITTTKQQQEKRSTCTHLSSHRTAVRSPIRTVSEEREENQNISLEPRSLTKDMSCKGWGLLCVFYGPKGWGEQFRKAERCWGKREVELRGPQKRQQNIT